MNKVSKGIKPIEYDDGTTGNHKPTQLSATSLKLQTVLATISSAQLKAPTQYLHQRLSLPSVFSTKNKNTMALEETLAPMQAVDFT